MGNLKQFSQWEVNKASGIARNRTLKNIVYFEVEVYDFNEASGSHSFRMETSITHSQLTKNWPEERKRALFDEAQEAIRKAYGIITARDVLAAHCAALGIPVPEPKIIKLDNDYGIEQPKPRKRSQRLQNKAKRLRLINC